MPFGFFSFKSKNKEDKVRDWLKLQSHDEDAIYYLIQKEIYENGVRDLSYVIPRLRNDEYFELVDLRARGNVENYPKVESIIRPKPSLVKNGYQDSETLSERITEPTRAVASAGRGSNAESPQSTYTTSSNTLVAVPTHVSDYSSIDTACFDD